MSSDDSDATRIHRAADDEAQDNDATRVADTTESDATRIAPKKVTQSQEESTLDPPTRLMMASARRMGHHRVFKPGTLIRERFRLEREIGRGGMGVVYTARDLRKEEVGDQDSLVAIKLLSDDFKDHPDALRMLQQETRKAQELAHPNIITVYDFDRDGDMVYMTMEYLTGTPLTDYVEEREYVPTDLKEVLPIISDIVHGLAYAHKRGIVHSDLKPGNIFLTDEGVTKLVDFGIARAVMDSEIVKKSTARAKKRDQPDSNESNATRTDTDQLIALTPKYASPEMFDDAPPDARDDIYALACITYQLLSGEHPFSGRPANEALSEALVPKAIPGLTDRQWKGLLSGLSLQRDTRIKSAEEFLAAFLPKRKEPWRWATLGVGILTLVVGGYFLLRPPQGAPLSDEDQMIVDQQLMVARQHLEVGSLGNALESYKMILALPPYDKEPPGGGFVQHPYDSVALADLDRLLAQFEAEAKKAIEAGRKADAKAFITAGLDVDEDHSGLMKLKKKLK